MEAKEYYPSVTNFQMICMVLYCSFDAIEQMLGDMGMQIHLSHWVVRAAVEQKYPR